MLIKPAPIVAVTTTVRVEHSGMGVYVHPVWGWIPRPVALVHRGQRSRVIWRNDYT